MPLDVMDVRTIVEACRWQEFLEQFEGEHLEAKSQPYNFVTNDGKRELAKDVAAFANAGGGCILLGAETTVSPLQAGEEITSLKPFPEGLFNIDQYRKLIEEWVYPVPSGLIIKWEVDANMALTCPQ